MKLEHDGTHVDTAEAAHAANPAIGEGVPFEAEGYPSAAPERLPDVSALDAQPAAIIGMVVAAIDAVLVAAVPLPEWLTAVLVAAVTVAGAFGIRSKVTPVAAPQLDNDTPLTP